MFLTNCKNEGEREKERRNNGIKWEISREWVFLADGKFRTVNNNIYTIETRRLFPQHFSSLSRSFFFAFSCYRSFFSFALCHVWHVLSFTQLHQWRRIKDFSTVYETSEKRTTKKLARRWSHTKECTLCVYIYFILFGNHFPLLIFFFSHFPDGVSFAWSTVAGYIFVYILYISNGCKWGTTDTRNGRNNANYSLI